MAMRRDVGLVLCFAFLCMSASAASDEQDRILNRQTSGVQGKFDCNSLSDPDQVLGRYLKPGTAMLIGEMHGTSESPQFVGDIACSALRANLKVAVALEIPSAEAPKLPSPSEAKDLRIPLRFTDDDFWRDSYQDGRRSAAMRNLIERLRGWQGESAKGHIPPVRLLTIGASRELHGAERDRVMASRLAEDMKARPDYVYLVLTGNIHNRLDPGTPWDINYMPMGLALTGFVEKGTSIVSLDPYYYEGGKAYICQTRDESSCGAVAITKQPRTEASTWDQAPRGMRINSIDARLNLVRGYYYFTRPVTFSLPAVPRGSS